MAKTKLSIVKIEAFENFWTAYPRHRAKAYAETCWKRLTPTAELANEITKAAWRYGLEVAGKPESFTLHASTFLNQKRWQDYMDEKETDEEETLTNDRLGMEDAHSHRCNFCPVFHDWICGDPFCGYRGPLACKDWKKKR